ncbi:dihydrofolate reductase [Deinococcus metalli]|uniref:Deaminase reductase n=1 Tax=Deinococcus metalli TaxID=1141878 RepID=A0A7W8NSZ2_9DEIO|nr:dihydrofolate reductase family protein [Deinococcus metalli]MBB5377647.1 dihydrofolate reductase [Deinococcus metalli]GHF52285.1 deaminase reductase [Deinococcus metalli]
MPFLVYIAASVDGFIARPDGSLDWLPGAQQGSPPMPTGEDHGYEAFMARVDTVVMGRSTFDTVREYRPWPYAGKRLVVLSRTLTPADLPRDLAGQVSVHPGPVDALAAALAGARGVYVDGGQTIQAFLRAGLLDELIVTRIPVLLGAGRPLFGALDADVLLRHVDTQAFPSGFVQSTYAPIRSS